MKSFKYMPMVNNLQNCIVTCHKLIVMKSYVSKWLFPQAKKDSIQICIIILVGTCYKRCKVIWI
jgi:hypothetical protein